MPGQGKKSTTTSRSKKPTGRIGNKKQGQSELVFHEIGRTDKGQGAMEKGYN